MAEFMMGDGLSLPVCTRCGSEKQKSWDGLMVSGWSVFFSLGHMSDSFVKPPDGLSSALLIIISSPGRILLLCIAICIRNLLQKRPTL